MLRFSAPLLALLASLSVHAAEVTVRGETILLDGKPFMANGAAGLSRFELLKQLGATTVRTYGEEPGPILDAAHKAGLMVIAGFWMGHPRQGFNYRDSAQVTAQLKALEGMVTRYRDHPALLIWGLGNEIEAEMAEDSEIWPAIEQAARLVRRLDPNHPSMAVLAETGKDKIARLRYAAPSVQVLGVNSYGGALPTVPDRVRAQGWTGPLIVTEMGPLGQWQAGRTPWDAAIEPTSDEKAELLARWLAALRPRVQGQIAFYWGHKQEVTPTWHSLLLASGEYTRTAEALAAAWGGSMPGGNRAPRIRHFGFAGGKEWRAGTEARAELALADPDNDPMKVTWQVMAESTDLKSFGDSEQIPAGFPNSLRAAGQSGVTIAGLSPGQYRLFVTVRDGKGAAATANLPFRIGE